MPNLFLILILSIFWLIASGIMHAFLLFCGAISVISTFFIYRFFIKISRDELGEDLHVYTKIPNIFITILNVAKLIADIRKSSFSLVKNIILEKEITPQIIEIDVNHIEHDFHVMLVAHSITMTPGSITILQDGKKILVHCLYKEIADEMKIK